MTYCDSTDQPFPVAPPVKEGEENIWGFQKIGTEFGITCNGVVVLKKDISPSSCADKKNSYRWERDVREVKFTDFLGDTAAAQFRLHTPGLYLFT